MTALRSICAKSFRAFENEMRSEKDKKWQKRQKPEILAFLPFLLPSRLTLQDLTL
jgi:hypothetical protein